MYFKKGRTTRQARVDLPEGTVEEEYAREGFFGRTSHLYRTEAPVGWIDIDAGMVTFHPQGLPHGPHPKAIEAAKSKQRTNEKAVMVDTRNPLEITSRALEIERTDYWKSWMASE